MSRSKRHNPIIGIAGVSDKAGKRRANRALRRAVRVALTDEELPVVPVLREVSDVWGMEKDGKRRFDPVKHPRAMRK